MEDNKIVLRGYIDFMKRNALAILAILLVLMFLLIFFFYKNPELAAELASTLGLTGILIGAIIANATIVIPIPFDVILLPVFVNPALVGLPKTAFAVILIGICAGVGSAIGECSSYVFGYLGIQSVKNLSKKDEQKLNDFKKSLENSGPVIIFVASFLPFPFDFVGVAAGMMKYNFLVFFTSALAGKVTRHVILALAVFYGIEFIASFFS